MLQSTCFLRKYFASKTAVAEFFLTSIKSDLSYCCMCVWNKEIVVIAAIKQMLVTNQDIVWCQRYVHRDKAVDLFCSWVHLCQSVASSFVIDLWSFIFQTWSLGDRSIWPVTQKWHDSMDFWKLALVKQSLGVQKDLGLTWFFFQLIVVNLVIYCFAQLCTQWSCLRPGVAISPSYPTTFFSELLHQLQHNYSHLRLCKREGKPGE